MKWSRVKGLLLQEYHLARRSLETVTDVVLFPLITLFIFGFIGNYLAHGGNNPAALYPLMGAILWEVIYMAQYSFSMSALSNIWSQTLTNIFITPIKLMEYVTGYFISAVIKSILLFFVMASLSIFAFHFNIFSLGILNLLLFILNMLVFALSLGLILLGLIFRYGMRLQSLAWGLIFILQPLSAAFFPVSVLPRALQYISYIFPTTFVFEGAREVLGNGGVPFKFIGIAAAENIVFFALAAYFFSVIWKKAKKTGQFVKIEL